MLKTNSQLIKEHVESGKPEEVVREYLQGQEARVKSPARYSDANAEKLGPELLKYMAEFDNKTNRQGAYIYGSVGTGKTYALYALARAFSINGAKVKIKNIVEILQEVKSTYDGNGYDKERVEEEWVKTNDVLFIDDLGTENLTEWATELIYRIINWRYENDKITFVSSNLTPEAMASRIGDRLVSRLVEMCKFIKIEGEDRRMK